MYLTLTEAAKLLHMNRDTLRVKFADGRIPGAFKTDGVRGDWRISEEDLRAWINRQMVHG